MSSFVTSVSELGDRAAEAVARQMEQSLRSVLVGRTTDAPGYLRMVTGEPHPFANFAFLIDPDSRENVESAMAPLRPETAPISAICPRKPSSHVHDLLESYGLQNHGDMPSMAVDIDDMSSSELPSGYRFARCFLADVDAWVQGLTVGFGVPESMSQMFSPAALPENVADDAPAQWFGIFKGDQVVATSVLTLIDGLAGIYCVSTLPEERGKGLGAYVTAEALRLAAQVGYRVGVLQASEMGFPVYNRLGFVTVGDIPLYVRT